MFNLQPTRMSSFLRLPILLCISLFLIPFASEAQILRNLTRKAERVLERKIEDKTEEAVILGVEKALESDSTISKTDSAGTVQDKATPFSAMMLNGNRIEVDYEGSWYTLNSLAGISSEEMKSYASDQAGDDWLGYLVDNTAGTLRALGAEFANLADAELTSERGRKLETEVRFYNTNHAFQRDFHTMVEQQGFSPPPRTFSQTVGGSFYGTDWDMVSGRAQSQWILGVDEDTDAKDLTRAIFGIKTLEKEEESYMVYLFGVETSGCGDIKDKTLEKAPFLAFPIKPRAGYATKTLYLYNYLDEEGEQQARVTQATTFFRAEVTKVEGNQLSGYFYYPKMEGDAFEMQGTWTVELCPLDD